MASHLGVNPLGIFENVKAIIYCIIVPMMFAGLDLPTTTQHPNIFGCPRLHDNNTTHNWTNNTLAIWYLMHVIIPL